jgi:uncharacterized FAD-dependent dehydrogenase
MVVEIHPEDFPQYARYRELALMKLQEEVEKQCWMEAHQTQVAPAQRMMDFVNGRLSRDLPSSSYSPGLQSSELNVGC